MDADTDDTADTPAEDAQPLQDELPPPTEREALLEAEVARYRDQALRALAETENTRRRLEQAAEDRGRYAVASFAKDMLQVADNLRRALEAAPHDKMEMDPVARSLYEGVELTERALLATLERHGVKRIEAKGKKFDANFHQAMMEVPDSGQPGGTVVTEIQAGYTIQDRLLRPSLVGVAKAKPGEGVDTNV